MQMSKGIKKLELKDNESSASKNNKHGDGAAKVSEIYWSDSDQTSLYKHNGVALYASDTEQ